MLPPPIHETEPDVFIIESLDLIDEEKRRFDGKILARTLELMGKKPIYYYFRTRAELEMLAIIYRESGYRYLHLSCHASLSNISLSMEDINYLEFAEIFKGLLKNRRLTLSACELGNEIFSTMVGVRNKGMYSICAPSKTISFEHSASFWTTYYVKLLSENKGSMKGDSIKSTIRNLTEILGCGFHLSRYLPKTNSWKHEEINGLSISKDRQETAAAIKMARKFLSEKDHDTCIKICEMAIKNSKSEPFLESRAKAVMAYALIEKEEFNQAINILSDVISYRGEKNTKIWHIIPLIYCYFKTKNHTLLQSHLDLVRNFSKKARTETLPKIVEEYYPELKPLRKV